MKTKHSPEEIDQCISMLEELVKDTEQFANLPEEQRIALLKAAGALSRPDRAEAKKRNKAAKKPQRLATLEKDRRARNTTGIRSARRDAVYTAPAQIEDGSSGSGQKAEELQTPQKLLCVQGRVHDAALFLRYPVQEMRRPELSQAFSDSVSSGPGRFDHRRARQDRLSGNAFDAACRRHGDRDDPVPCGCRSPLCQRRGICGVGRQAAYSRPRSEAYSERRAVHQLCRAAVRTSRYPDQQCRPDGTASRRVLCASDRQGEERLSGPFPGGPAAPPRS